jgi:hypothetical protein
MQALQHLQLDFCYLLWRQSIFLTTSLGNVLFPPLVPGSHPWLGQQRSSMPH